MTKNPVLKAQKFLGQFIGREVELLESPAWRVLSLGARRVLDRIDIEHSQHGGVENGRLPVTFTDFVKYGMDRHAVAPAVRELVALGFIEVTEKGGSGNGEHRRPNVFRLTYRADYRGSIATNDWRRFRSVEAAKSAANAARGEKAAPRGGRRTNPVGGKAPKRGRAGAATTTAGPGAEPPRLSISRPGGDSALGA